LEIWKIITGLTDDSCIWISLSTYIFNVFKHG
jgi:hypothetical protein